jgi:hypothetical protein
MMFNGRFFKGMKKYFKEGKIRKERNKKSWISWLFFLFIRLF